jgi:cephalosporin-C deacetylase-like acetyl esterase
MVMTIIKNVLIGVGMFLGVVLLYLIVIIFFPILSVPKQPIKKRVPKKSEPPKSRQDAPFYVEGSKISAWLYLPEESLFPVPCIVMSQGFGGTKDCILERYALRFVESGYAVLAYDFRHFGTSEGEPRQLFDTLKQHDDLRAAISYVRGRSEIDPEKIVLWGTSASGGYGLTIAAEDKRVAAVIAQCPGIDHQADSELFFEREGLRFFMRLFVHAQRDKGRSRFGLSPHKFPIVGQPGTIAMLTAPGAYEGYANLVAESNSFVNETCARLLFMAHGLDPVEASKQAKCPVLFLVCEHDNLVSPDSYKRAAEALGENAKVVKYPIGHFDIYEGTYFENAINEKHEFLKKVFLPES